MVVDVEQVNIVVVGKKKTIAVHFVTLESDEEWPNLSKYYFTDALGRRAFVKTNNRSIAQQTVDEMMGKGKYRVVCTTGEKGDGSVTCRATEYRKGQMVQRQKARILNS